MVPEERGKAPGLAVVEAALVRAGVDASDLPRLLELLERWPAPDRDRQALLQLILDDYAHWQLYVRSRTGDEAAARAFERHWSRSIRSARGRGFEARELEDVIAVFFVRVYRYVRIPYAWRSPFTVYLRTLLLNVVRAHGKHLALARAREVSLEDQQPGAAEPRSAERSAEERLLDAERHEATERAIRSIAPLDRQIVRAFFAEGEGAESIAKRLGLTREAVYKRAQRARARLRVLLTVEPTPPSKVRRGEGIR